MNPTVRIGSARRSLFGPVNHEQLRHELSLRLRDLTERDSRRWNFDFQNHAPLPGRYQWEHVPSECAAAFYGHERRGDKKEPREAAEERLRPSHEDQEEEDRRASDRENRPRVSNTLPTHVRRKRACSKSAATRSARVTDFFSKRRRSTDSKSVLSPVFSQNTEAPVRTLR